MKINRRQAGHLDQERDPASYCCDGPKRVALACARDRLVRPYTVSREVFRSPVTTVGPRAVAGHSKDLPHARPAERVSQVSVQRRRAGQRSFFLTTVCLGVGRRRLSLGRAFTLSVAGRSFLHEDRTAFCAVNSLEIAATHCGWLSFTGRA